MKLYELYFIDENKYTQLLKAGKLSKNALRSIQKYRPGPDKLYVKQLLKKGENELAQKYLAKKGIVKSARDWLAGVERGTENIFKKNNVKVVKDYGAKRYSSGIRFGRSGDYEAHFASRIKNKHYGDNVIIKRHEADEVRTKVNQGKKYGVSPTAIFSTKGHHASDEVLRKERELVRTTKGLHGDKVLHGNSIEKYRNRSGEYDILGTKKDIEKTDKLRIKKQIVIDKIKSDIWKKIQELSTKWDRLVKRHYNNELKISKLKNNNNLNKYLRVLDKNDQLFYKQKKQILKQKDDLYRKLEELKK